jgi:hypothetical protein
MCSVTCTPRQNSLPYVVGQWFPTWGTRNPRGTNRTFRGTRKKWMAERGHCWAVYLQLQHKLEITATVLITNILLTWRVQFMETCCQGVRKWNKVGKQCCRRNELMSVLGFIITCRSWSSSLSESSYSHFYSRHSKRGRSTTDQHLCLLCFTQYGCASLNDIFRRCANVIERTYTNLDSIAYYTPRQ